jgi:hypothetical protein
VRLRSLIPLLALAVPLFGQDVFKFKQLESGTEIPPVVKYSGTGCRPQYAKCDITALRIGDTSVHWDSGNGSSFDGTVTVDLPVTTPPLKPQNSQANFGVFQAPMKVGLSLKGTWTHPPLSRVPKGTSVYWSTLHFLGDLYPTQNATDCDTTQKYKRVDAKAETREEIEFTAPCIALTNLDYRRESGTVKELVGWGFLDVHFHYDDSSYNKDLAWYDLLVDFIVV